MAASILKRIADGEAGALRECIDEYGALVWSLARRLSRTPPDAEDATQEIFLQLWRQAMPFEAALSPEKAFIMLIARRRLIDRLRKARADPTYYGFFDESLTFPVWATSVNGLEGSIEIEQAMQMLAALPPAPRQVIELGCLYGFTHPQIAEQTGLPLGTVKSFMRRGLMSIRECFDAV